MTKQFTMTKLPNVQNLLVIGHLEIRSLIGNWCLGFGHLEFDYGC
jgi:hypothetical protein